MNQFIPAAAAAALIAGAATFEEEGQNGSYQWVRGDSALCSALLNGPGPDGIGPIHASVETGYRDEVFFVFRGASEDWPIAEDPQAFAIDVGFDGGTARTRIEEAWAWQPGGLQFEVDEPMRNRLAGAQSVEFYRDGRRIGAVPTNGLHAVLPAIDACAATEALPSPDGSTDMNAATDDMMITDMNATQDMGSEGNYTTPQDMDAVAAPERAT